MSWPLSLACGVVQEHGPERTVDAAIAGRFDGVGIWIEPENWTSANTRGVIARVNESGIRVLDCEVSRILPGPFDENILKFVDIGLGIGAENLIVVSYDPEPSSTAAKFRRMCEHAGDDIHVALEVVSFNLVDSLGKALDIIKQTGHPSAKILIDSLHLDRTGGVPADIARVDPILIDYVQICDVGPMRYAPDDLAARRYEGLEERVPCGEGTLPLADFLSALPSHTPLSVEIRSKPFREAHPDPLERAQFLFAQMRRFLNSIAQQSANHA